MFDIGFSELLVCAVVALIVIGPERMPEAVRTVGLWIGRIKRSLRSGREEFERQMGVDDIRRQLHNEDIMRSIEKSREDINSVIAQGQNSIHQTAQETTPIYGSEPDLPYHSHMNEQKESKPKKATVKKTTAKSAAPKKKSEESLTAASKTKKATTTSKEKTKTPIKKSSGAKKPS